MSLTDRESLVEAWNALDRRSALLPADREVIAASDSVRGLILELASVGGSDDELYDACAALGRLIAQHSGSATLASSTLDHAVAVLNLEGAPWLAHARAAVVEGFTLSLFEKAKQLAFETWAFPRCAVFLPDGGVAIAAGHPSSEPEELSEWAAVIGKAAALRGVRYAFVAGPPLARQAIEEALELVGITIKA